jgi:hypothetical protein
MGGGPDQRMCFKIAKKCGFEAFVLKVKVEPNISKDFCLMKFRPKT